MKWIYDRRNSIQNTVVGTMHLFLLGHGKSGILQELLKHYPNCARADKEVETICYYTSSDDEESDEERKNNDKNGNKSDDSNTNRSIKELGKEQKGKDGNKRHRLYHPQKKDCNTCRFVFHENRRAKHAIDVPFWTKEARRRVQGVPQACERKIPTNQGIGLFMIATMKRMAKQQLQKWSSVFEITNYKSTK
jgi:hypothetical protein